MYVRVAINGIDYTGENDNTVFTFVGTATVFVYWPYIIGIILGLLALIALILCCHAVVTKATEIPEEGPEEERNRRVASGSGGRPHTLRDEFNFCRTRGYFQEHPQSPAPGGRPSANPRANELRSVLHPSPGGYQI